MSSETKSSDKSGDSTPDSRPSTPSNHPDDSPGDNPVHDQANLDQADIEKQVSRQPTNKSQLEAFRVDWEENDPANPRNFPFPKKAFITVQLGLLAFAASVGSSITSPAEEAISAYANISAEVTVLTVSLYVLGFALGYVLTSSISSIYHN